MKNLKHEIVRREDGEGKEAPSKKRMGGFKGVLLAAGAVTALGLACTGGGDDNNVRARGLLIAVGARDLSA